MIYQIIKKIEPAWKEISINVLNIKILAMGSYE